MPCPHPAGAFRIAPDPPHGQGLRPWTRLRLCSSLCGRATPKAAGLLFLPCARRRRLNKVSSMGSAPPTPAGVQALSHGRHLGGSPYGEPVRDLLVIDVANVISAEMYTNECKAFGHFPGRNPVKDGFAFPYSPKESGKSILYDSAETSQR